VGRGDRAVTPSRRVRSQRSQHMAVVYAVMVSLLLLILLQVLLLMVALEDFLSGRRSLLWAAAGGSALCFGASCWLIRYITPRRLF
jgi:hypothetical protein